MVLVVLTFMTMTTCTRTKGFVTANVTSYGPLHEWLQTVPGRHIVAIQEYHMRYIDRVHYAKNELAKDRQIIRRYITTLEGQKSSDQSFDCPSEDQDIPLPEVESKSNEPLLITF